MVAKVLRSEYEAFKRSYDAGDYRDQRWGQAFFNRFLPGNYPDPELWYCTNKYQAVQIAEDRYVEAASWE